MRYHKAPAARIYESAQPVRQQRFSERRRSVKFSIDAKRPQPQVYGKKGSRKDLDSQRTVTQMGWMVPEEEIEMTYKVNDSDEDMRSESEREGGDAYHQRGRDQLPEQERPRKRRRTLCDKTESQDTLTQMHWFVGDSEEDEEDISDVEGSIHSEQEEESEEEEDPENDENFEIPPSGQGDTSPLSPSHIRSATKSSPTAFALSRPVPSTPSTMSPSPTKSLNAENPQSILQRPSSESPENIFKVPKTPQKRTPRREIPSSQSPATTPVSMIANVDTPSKSKRTPLAEIPRNELAVRDLSASPSPTKRKMPTIPSKSSASSNLQNRQTARQRQVVDDSDDDDEENWDPESNVPKISALGKKQSSAPSDVDPITQAQPSQITNAFTSAYGPASSSKFVPLTGSSGGRFVDTQFTHTLVRSSQASTIDPASQGEYQQPQSSSPPQQKLPRESAPSPAAISNSPADTSPQFSSFRTACESSMPQLPASVALGTQWQRGRWRACSPVGSINESADVVTVSQLVPKDLGKEFDGDDT